MWQPATFPLKKVPSLTKILDSLLTSHFTYTEIKTEILISFSNLIKSGSVLPQKIVPQWLFFLS